MSPKDRKMQIKNKINLWVFLMCIFGIVTTISAFSQSIANANNPYIQPETKYSWFMEILPLITFLFALITGALNLYVMNKVQKMKEEIFTSIESDMKEESKLIDNKIARLVNKESFDSFKQLLDQKLENISLQNRTYHLEMLKELKSK